MERVLGGVRGPGGAAFDGAAPATTDRQEVGVHLSGDSKVGGEFLDNGGVH